jgi:mono/diheme cytochrome c family protein
MIVAILLFAMAPHGASAQNVIEGRKAWLRLNCYGCHGDSGEGARAPRVRGQDATNIRNAMRGDFGSSGMPSYLEVRGVKPTDFADLAAYLRSIGTTSEPKWHDWWRR